MKTHRYSVALLRLGADHAQIDPAHVEALRTRQIHDERPIEVEHEYGDCFVIRNGRHRFLAAVLRGEHDIECVLR